MLISYVQQNLRLKGRLKEVCLSELWYLGQIYRLRDQSSKQRQLTCLYPAEQYIINREDNSALNPFDYDVFELVDSDVVELTVMSLS